MQLVYQMYDNIHDLYVLYHVKCDMSLLQSMDITDGKHNLHQKKPIFFITLSLSSLFQVSDADVLELSTNSMVS